MIKSLHIFQNDKINTTSKFFATIKHIFSIICKKGFTEKIEGTNFIVKHVNGIFCIDKEMSNNNDDIHDQELLESINNINFYTNFKNNNKRLSFVYSGNTIFF